MNDELQHHGVLGMKWGVRKTQLSSGHPFRARKIKKQRSNALKKAREVRKQKLAYEAGKQQALKSGSASDILKYKGDLTNDQMRNAIDRISLEQRLSDMKPQVSSGHKFISKVGKNILSPVATDVSKQMVKSGMVYLVNNHVLPSMNLDGEEYKIYTNNKRK